MQKVVLPILLAAWMLSLPGCREHAGQPKSDPQSAASGTGPAETHTAVTGCKPLHDGQVLKVTSHEVEIMVPDGDVRADLLVLPGWNFPRTDWCSKSSLCRRALRKGYRLIMPEMGKSIYATQYFPESRPDWRVYPTRTWVTDTLIPYLQEEHCALQRGGHNYLVGLSTGARGVALITLYRPGLFSAGAGLSGDYDQRLMTGDNLMRGVYGDFESFPERWLGEDNPTMRAADFTTPLYLGHGREDDVIPYEQTEVFYNALREAKPDLQVVLHLADNKGHDYGYWNSEVDDMLSFFDRFQNSTAESVE